MRIVHVVPSYLPAVRYGGPVTSVHGLCKALSKRGHDVHVFTTSVDGPLDSNVPHGLPVDREGVKVFYFRSRYLRRLYWSPAMATMLSARVGSFDIAHLHSIFLWPTWAAACAARRSAVPYIVAPRGMLEKGLIQKKSRLAKSAWIALIERRNLERAAAIHVTSRREAREAFSLGLSLPRVFCIPNGMELQEAAGDDPHPEHISAAISSGPFVLFLGRLNWKKGLDRLIAALRHMPAINLIVAGNDEENYRPVLVADAKRHGVASRIIFVGAVHGAAKAALLRHASALILPSYSENFGNVVLEAMSAACPVVVTPEVGAAEIVQETGAGCVVSGEPELLAAAISNLLANPADRAEMGRRGREAVAESYTWDAVACAMETAYRAALDCAGPPAADRAQPVD